MVTVAKPQQIGDDSVVKWWDFGVVLKSFWLKSVKKLWLLP
jgi:hypothetical protein